MLTAAQEKLYLKLCQKEKDWHIEKYQKQVASDDSYKVYVRGVQFPLTHPYKIHLKLYKDETDPATKLSAMKSVHDILWPHHIKTWNHWQERRFLAHCEGWEQITLAGGSGIGKSIDVAKVAYIFFQASPRDRGCVIASTTLDSLESRIWGYIAKLHDDSMMNTNTKILGSKPPKIIHVNAKDKLSGMFAIAAKEGDDKRTINTIFGRHPSGGILIVLDESTDMPAAIIDAMTNLEQGTKYFQIWAIGNSSDKNDLHGALATPLAGWDSIDPHRDYVWPTVRKKSICLYFNPYDSPAIHEKDPVKKKALSDFLITKEKIDMFRESLGENSLVFWRFVMGFWQEKAFSNTLVSKQFLSEHEVYKNAEWSGFYPLSVVGGLDPAFSMGSTGCVLRLAIWGHATDEKMALDFRGKELLFRIQIRTDQQKSGELQIAEQVIHLLKQYNCPLSHLAIDITGAGRALGELIKILWGTGEAPIKISSTPGQLGPRKSKEDPSITLATPMHMWMTLRQYIQHKQIKGLDEFTIRQITNRLIVQKNSKEILESKADYKSRMAAIDPKLAHSPDEADASILALHAAIIRFGFAVGMRRENPKTGIDDFWIEKLVTYKGNLERLGGGESTPRQTILLPNFSGKLEDITG